MIINFLKYILLIIMIYGIIAVISTNPSNAQEVIYADIADKIVLKYGIDSLEDKEYILEGTLKLHNPSMVYPIELSVNNSTAQNLILQKHNDSTYQFDISFNGNRNQNFELSILCEILAGNDSVANISLESVSLNSDTKSNKEFKIIVNTLYQELPYLRFTQILKIYPNPLFGNSTINIEYVCDIVGEVEINLIGLLRQYYFLKKSIINTAGLQKVQIDFNHEISSGYYRIELVTKFGKVSKPFILVR